MDRIRLENFASLGVLYANVQSLLGQNQREKVLAVAKACSRAIHVLALAEVCQDPDPPHLPGWKLVSHFRGPDNRGVAIYRREKRTELPPGVQILPGPPSPDYLTATCDYTSAEFHFSEGELHELRGFSVTYRNPKNKSVAQKEQFCGAFVRKVESETRIGSPPPRPT